MKITAPLHLTVQPDPLVVCRLEARQPIPDWALSANFVAITRTADELSIVCPADRVPQDMQCVGNWRGLKVEGPLDFALTGVLAGLAAALAAANISLFAISTFDTDYILVREESLPAATEALRRAGYGI
jgi:hypothetical protein